MVARWLHLYHQYGDEDAGWSRTGGQAAAITASCAGLRRCKNPSNRVLAPNPPDFPLYSDTPILFFPANPSPVAALVAEARGNRVRGLDGADFDEKTRLEKNYISTTFFL